MANAPVRDTITRTHLFERINDLFIHSFPTVHIDHESVRRRIRVHILVSHLLSELSCQIQAWHNKVKSKKTGEGKNEITEKREGKESD